MLHHRQASKRSMHPLHEHSFSRAIMFATLQATQRCTRVPPTSSAVVLMRRPRVYLIAANSINPKPPTQAIKARTNTTLAAVGEQKGRSDAGGLNSNACTTKTWRRFFLRSEYPLKEESEYTRNRQAVRRCQSAIVDTGVPIKTACTMRPLPGSTASSSCSPCTKTTSKMRSKPASRGGGGLNPMRDKRNKIEGVKPFETTGGPDTQGNKSEKNKQNIHVSLSPTTTVRLYK